MLTNFGPAGEGNIYLVSKNGKGGQPRPDLRVGDVVIVKHNNVSRSQWQLARVATVYSSADGYVRQVQVALADSNLDKEGVRRSSMRICFGENSSGKMP